MADARSTDYPSLLRLDGRGFVVMGAGQGIGAEASRALAQAGASLLCVDNDPGRAEEIANETGGTACVADVTERGDVERVFAEARALPGGLGGIVDIVGLANVQPLSAFTDEAWEAQFRIVFRHAWLAVQLGGAALADAGGGSIAFVGSLSGARALPGQVAYGTAKAALHHLVRTAARELAPKGVRINAVAPGYVRTPRLSQLYSADQWARLEAQIPLGHAAQPSEIASALLFLSSDLASHVTGHILAVDGGLAVTTSLPDPS